MHGHAAGDQVLIDIANLLRSTLRHNDLVCRLGGDEFLIFLSYISNDRAAENKARSICELVRNISDPGLQVSTSIGMAAFPRDGIDFDVLYRKADTALYHVKASGKDNFAFYNDGMGTMQR